MHLQSDREVEALDQFLMSDLLSDETLMLGSLDGYLTAIAIGPIKLMPSEWLPRIWGLEPDDAPEFESMERVQRVMNLIVRHFNSIIASLKNDPDSIAPIFNENELPDDPHVYLDAENWALGFMQGVDLCRSA